MKNLLLNAKLPLDTLFNHYAGGHGPSSDGRTLLLEIDEATKLLKEFKLLKGVTAEGVIAQTDAAAAFNHASKKGPREGGVAHLPRAGMTPRNSRAILGAQFSARNSPRNPLTRRPPAAHRLRRVPPPARDRRPQGRRRAAADERADAPRGAQAAPRVRHRGDEEDVGTRRVRHRRPRQEGGGSAEGGGAKGGRSETAHPRRPRARSGGGTGGGGARAAKAAAAPAAAAANRVVAPKRVLPLEYTVHSISLEPPPPAYTGAAAKPPPKPPPARVVVGARVGSLPYATSPPVAVKPPSKYEGAAAVAVEWSHSESLETGAPLQTAVAALCYPSYVKPPPPPAEPKVRAAFDKFDTDKNGELDASELQKALTQLGEPPDSAVMATHGPAAGASFALPQFRALLNQVLSTQRHSLKLPLEDRAVRRVRPRLHGGRRARHLRGAAHEGRRHRRPRPLPLHSLLQVGDGVELRVGGGLRQPGGVPLAAPRRPQALPRDRQQHRRVDRPDLDERARDALPEDGSRRRHPPARHVQEPGALTQRIRPAPGGGRVPGGGGGARCGVGGGVGRRRRRRRPSTATPSSSRSGSSCPWCLGSPPPSGSMPTRRSRWWRCPIRPARCC